MAAQIRVKSLAEVAKANNILRLQLDSKNSDPLHRLPLRINTRLTCRKHDTKNETGDRMPHVQVKKIRRKKG